MSDQERFQEIGQERLLWMYAMLVRCRRFDERLLSSASAYYHSGIGQEAVGVGACAALRRDDYILYDHRGCTQIIAKGLPLEKIYGDLFDKATGSVRGKGGGIIHCAAPELGILGQSGTLGGCFPIALGAALSAQYRHTDQVVVCFYGEGTANRGTFHEALNWAALRKAPLILICENNGYAISVPVSASTAGRLYERGLGFGVGGELVDGQDVIAVYLATKAAVERARAGEGPWIIEAQTYRYRGHYEGDRITYRTREEVELWKQRDPLLLFRQRLLLAEVASHEELAELERRVDEEVGRALQVAREAPLPDPDAIYEDVYA